MVLLSTMFFICGVLAIYFYAKFTETLTLGELSVNIDYLLYSAILGSLSVMFFSECKLYALSGFFLFVYFLNFINVLVHYFGKED